MTHLLMDTNGARLRHEANAFICKFIRLTPRSNTIPVGADVHIKYKSKRSFGAVLITQKPITLTSYNDETLFQSWLLANKSQLFSSHGPQLRRHGLFLVTRTYTAPSCSINAWVDRNSEANMSVKAKANMMGELGETLDLKDKLTDQDWSHYSGKDKGDTVVVFFDGIEVPAWEWYFEGLRTTIGRIGTSEDRSTSLSSHTQRPDRPPNTRRSYSSSFTDESMDEGSLFSEDLWGSDTPLQIYSPLSSRSPSRGRQVRFEKAESARHVSTPTRLSKYLAYDEKPPIPTQRSRAAPIANHRLSMMSSPTPSSSAGTRAPSLKVESSEVESSETSTPPIRHRNELRRKTGSPSLRGPR